MVSFPSFKHMTLVCLILVLSIGFLPVGAKAQASLPAKELSVTLNGKPVNFKEKYSVQQLDGILEFNVKGHSLVQITLYLVRGRRPIKIKTIKGPEDYKDFQLRTWLQGEKDNEKEGASVQSAQPGDRIVFEYAWDGGGGAVNLHIK